MKTSCPFCKQAHVIGAEHLDGQMECSACHRMFSCSLVAKPILGPMYLDIETTELAGDPRAEISTIVWWCDGEWYSWVNGRDESDQFLLYWKYAPEIITFYGKKFDEPMICAKFDLSRHPCHRDMLIVAGEKGICGKLKEIGQQLKFLRPEELDNVDGVVAVDLWKLYKSNHEPAVLQALLYYNAWDVVLTYMLRNHIEGRQSDPIDESIPFTQDKQCLLSILAKPSPSAPPSRRQPSPRLKAYWEHRKENPLPDLRGAEVLITGNLKGIEATDEDRKKLIEDLGGIWKKSVVDTLDFLVKGSDAGFRKMEQVRRNVEAGAHTQVIDKDQFRALAEKTRDAGKQQ